MAIDVLSVLINWRRPQNARTVVNAIRAQTVKSHLCLIECSPGSIYSAADVHSDCDCVISVTENLGPCSRFIAPLMFPQYRYTVFFVDDHAPGPRHVECLLRTAESLNGKFATIGQDGRIIRDGQIIKRRARLDPGSLSAVDFVTSSELMETRRMPEVIAWRAGLLAAHDDPSMLFEDDLILCMALQMKANSGSPVPCYLTRRPASDDEWWAAQKLPAPFALSARADHHEKRELFVRRAIESGQWVSQTQGH